MNKYIVILNAEAGAMAASTITPAALRDIFARGGIDAEITVVAPDKVAPAVTAARQARPAAVVVGGGDGTVRGAAAILADSGVPLGVLPLGTLNHFAKDLKLPDKPDAAAEALLRGSAVDVDVGEVNGHVFVNNCSLGSYAEAVRRRDALRAFRGHGKWRAMARASFEAFRRLRRLRLRVAVDAGPARSIRTPLAVIGNNRYSGHVLNRSLRPRLDAGELWLYTIHAPHHLAVIRMVLQSLIRRLDLVDALESEPGREFVITGENGPVPVALDGEVIALKDPLHFRIRPRALRVLMPPPPAPE